MGPVPGFISFGMKHNNGRFENYAMMIFVGRLEANVLKALERFHYAAGYH